ncbi:U32 family peptidase [Vagococcus lutrae]|uniref:peptidase U32 family protein n=1 Tax=Vagococcus lutrae TaxID=81947 RepID=UPI001C961C25|nr:peptidase U32 family protein [Vagococcus lutrae]QZN88179.1 U32 family peptidase [Vagococcus lutrae]
MSIKITATVESYEQAHKLLEAGVDTLYFGEEKFGLRLPTSFSREEQVALIELAHKHGKTATVAVNGIMHPAKMKEVPDYLDFLAAHHVDQITVGDTGVIHVLRGREDEIPYLYDGHTMVTSARQINFWGKRGAIGAVIAREVPFEELKQMAPKLDIFGEILVYGASCIHQSKRPLVENYLSYIGNEHDKSKEAGLFLSEPRKGGTHYSIYEDSHGTHIFANNDISLMNELGQLVAHDYRHWKLDGIYTPGETFVEIVSLFIEARQAIIDGTWTAERAEELAEKVQALHPEERGLDTGFFLLDPDEVK